MKKKANKPPDASFRNKSCTGKKKYRTEAEAADMISTQMEFGRSMDGVHPYRCRFCNKWHLGHSMEDG
jgi:hypothetical protein